MLSELFECARVLKEVFLLPVNLYGSETMIWREKEKSRIMVVQMDNLRGLLGIRRMDKVPNTRIRKLCEGTRDEIMFKGFVCEVIRVSGFAQTFCIFISVTELP